MTTVNARSSRLSSDSVNTEVPDTDLVADVGDSGEAKKMRLDDDSFAVDVVDYNNANAAKKLTDSLKSTGFAVLTNSPVSDDLIQEVYAEWRAFMIQLHKEATAGSGAGLDKKY